MEDAHQREGIGSLMLRYQIALARARGFQIILAQSSNFQTQH